MLFETSYPGLAFICSMTLGCVVMSSMRGAVVSASVVCMVFLCISFVMFLIISDTCEDVGTNSMWP